MAFTPAVRGSAKIGDDLSFDPVEDAVELGLADPAKGY
jgi:hypothetical protein